MANSPRVIGDHKHTFFLYTTTRFERQNNALEYESWNANTM